MLISERGGLVKEELKILWASEPLYTSFGTLIGQELEFWVRVASQADDVFEVKVCMLHQL